MPPSNPLKIMTAGGSLGGLMTSIALKRLGHHVTIYERSPTPLLHDQGAGIVASGDVQTFFSQYEKSGRSIAVESKERLYLDKEGVVIDREEKTQRMTSWDLLYFLLRGEFDVVESEYVPKSGVRGRETGKGEGVYEYGRIVRSVREEDGKVVAVVEYTRDDDEAGHTEEVTADLVIVADGPSSRLRKLLSPFSQERTYAGYVAFRGTVPETELSPEAKEVFIEKFPFFHGAGTQILAYAIPGTAGNLETGQRMVNWVWYVNIEEASQEYQNTMTDAEGKTHRYTCGPLSTATWQTTQTRAKQALPPQFAELVRKTSTPFVQAITDVPPPADGKTWVLNGKGVLVGDALCGFRPHTAASTGQAALHALLLGRVFAGEMRRTKYEERVVGYARELQRRGIELGERSQFGRHPLEG